MSKATPEAAIDALIQGNPGLFFEGFTQIKGKSGKRERPRMNILQRRVNAFHMARRAKGACVRGIGLKPRKRGFSSIVGAIHYTELCKNSFEACVVGNKLETSDTVFRMMRGYYDHDEIAKEHRWSSPAKWTTENTKWDHGSLLSQSTAMNGESIRGQTPQLVHGTEVAHWENAEDVLLALLNAVPDDPCTSIYLESTPNGNAGAFAGTWGEARWPTPDECPDGVEYWRYWESDCPDNPDTTFGDSGFVRIFAAWFEFDDSYVKLNAQQKEQIRLTLDERSWYDGEKVLIAKYGNTRESDGVERLGLEVEECDIWEQLAWRRATIKSKCGGDPKKFDQEYPADPASCFLASGSPVFDSDAVSEYAVACRGVTPDYGTIELSPSKRATWRPSSVDAAPFHRWETPKRGCSYLISVDTAEGEDQTKGDDPDCHSVLVWRRAYIDENQVHWKARLVARIAPPNRMPIHALVELVERLHVYYGRAIVLPEMNNSGLAFIVGCRPKNITIWKRKEWNPRSGKEEEKDGWRTTDTADYGGVRTLIVEQLKQILRERAVHCTCPHVVHELGKFVVLNGKPQASEGEHDDDVMSMAIGLYNIDAATLFAEPTVERDLPRDLRDAEMQSAGGLAMRT